MKFLIAIALILSTSVFANDLAKYRFSLSAQGTTKNLIHVIEATVTDSFVLEVNLHTSEMGQGHFSAGNTTTQQFDFYLNRYTANTINSEIKVLRNAQIKKSFHQIVCMMMPNALQSNDHLSIEKDGALELIMSPQGCWLSSKVSPAKQSMKARALKLKALIKAVTLEKLQL